MTLNIDRLSCSLDLAHAKYQAERPTHECFHGIATQNFSYSSAGKSTSISELYLEGLNIHSEILGTFHRPHSPSQESNKTMSSSGSGTSLGSDPNLEDKKFWVVDQTPVRDYATEYDTCVVKGSSLIEAYEAAVSCEAPDVNPVPVLMSEPSNDYFLEIQTETSEIAENTERLTTKNNGMKKILEQNYFDRHPEIDLEDLPPELRVIATDYRHFSVNNPNSPHADVSDRPYVGWVSQTDKTLVWARRYKDQDRAENKAYPSNITFAVWSHIATKSWDPEITPLEVHELEYIAMNDVVNPKTSFVCRQVYKNEGINLNNDAETRDGLYMYPGSKDWIAVAGTPNIGSIWRMVADHHQALRNKKPVKLMVKFRPYRFNKEETGYTRLVDRNDDMLKGTWFIGVTMG
ncbi:hypothetical protein ABW20_dc0110013 [Dactylellina cionopaga]|nr:hypothetical protein ABW20_dc0110013 [Dactylellina cionopaga]